MIPDTEVMVKAGMQSVHTLLKLAQLRWTRHVTRMSGAIKSQIPLLKPKRDINKYYK